MPGGKHRPGASQNNDTNQVVRFRLGEGLSKLHQHAPVLCVPELGALEGHSYDGAVPQCS
jgi:hypothetical protein